MSTNLGKQKWALEFAVRRSIRYHARRRGFFESCHKFFTFLIILLSSGSLTAIFNDSSFSKWSVAAGLTVTVLATLDLVIGFSRKAKDHEIFYKRYHDLLIDIETSHATSNDQLKEWKRNRLKIEADEPPVYRALDASCYNEEAKAAGCDKSERYIISLRHWILMHLWCFSDTEWKRHS